MSTVPIQSLLKPDVFQCTAIQAGRRDNIQTTRARTQDATAVEHTPATIDGTAQRATGHNRDQSHACISSTGRLAHNSEAAALAHEMTAIGQDGL